MRKYRLALYGGSFDPPHVGHLQVIEDLLKIAAKVVVVPSGRHPLKPPATEASVRYEMTQKLLLGVSEPERVEVSDFEVRNPDTPNYTVDSVSYFKQTEPELAFVIGRELLAELPTWRNFETLIGSCHWIVLERKGASSALFPKVMKDWHVRGFIKAWDGQDHATTVSGTELQCLPTAAPEISSSDVRASLIQGNTQGLTSEVLDYITSHNVYGVKNATQTQQKTHAS